MRQLFEEHRLIDSSPFVIPAQSRLHFVCLGGFQVCWSVTGTASWTLDLRCDTLLAASRDKCPSAYFLSLRVICRAVRPGGTPRTGRRLSACGRKGLKGWQSWELWSICWSRTSLAPNRCRTAVGIQRPGGSRAGIKKRTKWIYEMICFCGHLSAALHSGDKLSTLEPISCSRNVLVTRFKHLRCISSAEIVFISPQTSDQL